MGQIRIHQGRNAENIDALILDETELVPLTKIRSSGIATSVNSHSSLIGVESPGERSGWDSP